MIKAWETQGQDTVKLSGQVASRYWRRMIYNAMDYESLEKDLENDDKACNVSSSYYVSTPAKGPNGGNRVIIY